MRCVWMHFRFDMQYAQISRRIDKRKCITNICACRDDVNQFDTCYARSEAVFNIDDWKFWILRWLYAVPENMYLTDINKY